MVLQCEWKETKEIIINKIVFQKPIKGLEYWEKLKNDKIVENGQNALRNYLS